MKCQKCNAENPEIAKFCHSCGGNLEDNIKYDNKSEELNPEKCNRNTNKIKVISGIVLLSCLIFIFFVVFISNSAEPSSDSDVEYIAYEEEIESFEYSEEELFKEKEETFYYGNNSHKTTTVYTSECKILYVSSIYDNGEENGINYTYDDQNRLLGMSVAAPKHYDRWTINLFSYYEDEEGNFVSTGNFEYSEYDGDVFCKYDENNRLLEFNINDDDGDAIMYEKRSYYSDGKLERKETKSEGSIEVSLYKEDGALYKVTRGSTEYFYERYNNIDILSSDNIVEETENEIKIENCLYDGTVKGYTVWEFDENGNEIKKTEYDSSYVLESETYYTWVAGWSDDGSY